VRIVNLTKRFGDVTALDDVTLDVADGSIVGLIGRNGSGKTTLLESMMKLVRPDSGSIEYGFGITDRDLRQKMGAILQQTAYYEQIKVKEILRLFASYYTQVADVPSLVEALDLEPYLDKYVSQLSGGTQQRVNLALAFINEPSLAILDEPTTGLDPLSREYFWTALRAIAPGSTVWLSTHSMEEIEVNCDQLVVLDAGRVVYSGEIGGFVALQHAGSLNEAYMRMATASSTSKVTR